ncbi:MULTISPECIES: CPBP family intramembrane glutamic endopeptidase [Marinomonas]
MPFYLLGLSILLVFVPYKLPAIKAPLWCVCCLLAVFSGFMDDVLSVQGVLVVLVYTSLLFASLKTHSVWLRRAAVCAFAILSLTLAMHLLPGFTNQVMVQDHVVSVDGRPFSLYANFDKGLVGLFLLGYFFKGQVTIGYFQALQQPRRAVMVLIMTPCLALGLALVLGLIQFDVKLPNFWLAFLGINLLFTCVAEEAFFRGFLQRELSIWLAGKTCIWVAPIVSAMLFGIAHMGGGVEYAIVASVAGLGYGGVYYLTKRIEYAILCHFILNGLHFLFFTYPMLA